MVEELKEDILQDFIGSHDKVVVQFSASWCGNCRIMKPKMKKLDAEHEGITFVTIDAEKFPNSRQLATVDNLRLSMLEGAGKISELFQRLDEYTSTFQ